MTRITLIAAMTKNRVIGKDGDLAMYNKKDMAHFKKLTTGHCVIMGRKTFDSIPGCLPNRKNFVITSNVDNVPKVNNEPYIVNSLEEAIYYSELVSDPMNSDNETFIIGGGQVYKEALDKGLADRVLLTVFNESIEGDTLFPEINEDKYELVKEDVETGQEEFVILTYTKKA